MPFSARSTLREVIEDEEARVILDKHMPGASSHPMLSRGLGMTLAAVSRVKQSGLSPKVLEKVLEDLEKLDESRESESDDEDE
jgi:hypothetical protein